MKVKVRPLLNQGRVMPGVEANRQPPVVGVLNIGEARDLQLGRSVTRAQLKHLVEGIPLLPDLIDAKLVWLENGRLRLSGVERLDRVEYSQTWAIEVTQC